jgi:hypothetical protein
MGDGDADHRQVHDVGGRAAVVHIGTDVEAFLLQVDRQIRYAGRKLCGARFTDLAAHSAGSGVGERLARA